MRRVLPTAGGLSMGQKWSLDLIAQSARATATQDRDRLELVSLIERAARLRGTPLAVAR
jgi:hypothetical protein